MAVKKDKVISIIKSQHRSNLMRFSGNRTKEVIS